MSRYLAATPRDLGELIRGFRKQRGWTQARLAERAGLLPKTVSAIEAGSGQVLLANVMRCLSALDVDLSLDSRTEAATAPVPAPTAAKALEEKW
jgi:HTH-type transcriptional regulator/antitoxin HipB